MSSTPTDPIRPSRMDVVRALLLAAAPETPIQASHQPDESGIYERQKVRIPDWELEVIWQGGNLAYLSHARDAMGREWSYGCDRWPDWSHLSLQPVDPIYHLLTDGQRRALRDRLLSAPCDPPAPMPENIPTVDEIMTTDYMELMGV